MWTFTDSFHIPILFAQRKLLRHFFLTTAIKGICIYKSNVAVSLNDLRVLSVLNWPFVGHFLSTLKGFIVSNDTLYTVCLPVFSDVHSLHLW